MGARTQIGMRNSSTCTVVPRPSRNKANPWCRSIPKRRNWLASAATVVASGPLNGGREWSPQGQPEEVEVHDFPSKTLGKVIPYGVYDEATNTGWVSVGVDHDTVEFAVETVRRWWRHMGSQVYPKAKRLLITADGGGSTGRRCRLWTGAWQRLAEETGRRLAVCPLPPGTRKGNKLEPRLCCPMPETGRGRPVGSREGVVHRIGHTTPTTG